MRSCAISRVPGASGAELGDALHNARRAAPRGRRSRRAGPAAASGNRPPSPRRPVVFTTSRLSITSARETSAAPELLYFAPPVAHVAAALQAAADQRRQQRRRVQVLVRLPQQIVVLHRLADQLAELLLVGGEELVERVEGASGRVAGVRADLLADERVEAVVERHLQRRDRC